MDNRKEELKVLGFIGILKESFKIIFSRKKTLAQISLCFLIPLTIIFQLKIVTDFWFSFYKLKYRVHPQVVTFFFIPQYPYINFSFLASGKWTLYWFLSGIVYLTLLLIFSLLSTVTIARTVTSIYTAKDVNFKKATAVIPKIWKRVLITLVLIFAITFVYDYLLGPVLGLILRLLFFGKYFTIKLIAGIILQITYIVLFVYITIIFCLASVVSVMEYDMSGMKAILKSRKLIRGKMAAVVAVFVVVLIFSAGVEVFVLVDAYGFISFPVRVGVGIVIFILKLLLILLGFVAQTVIYFVCKSYHDENIEECVADEEAMDVQLVRKLPV